MKYLYYPGCSLKGTSRPYEETLLAVFSKLGVETEEIEDWNCCGTTSVVAVNKVLALALAARNLALAEATGMQIVAPCPSCSLSLIKVNNVMKEGGQLAEKVKQALAAGGLTYNGTTKVRQLLEFLVNEVGIEKIQKAVTKPLHGMRVAPYYGCQVVRPYAESDDAYDPQNLEKIIKALGAEPAPFEQKTACCSGSMMATRKEIGSRMSNDILTGIRKVGANTIVTPCPLCQLNLELAQFDNNVLPWKEVELPVLNLAQLVGLAMDVTPKELGFSKSLLTGVARKIQESQSKRAKLEEAPVIGG